MNSFFRGQVTGRLECSSRSVSQICLAFFLRGSGYTRLFTVMENQPKFLPPPENAATLRPSEARAVFRENRYYGSTTGFCRGYLQANVVVFPEQLADEFEEFCRRNRAPLPLLYRSKPGEVGAPPLAEDSDIRTDLPRYIVFSKGRMVEDTLDLSGFSWENRTTFYTGCSFTFEEALIQGGIQIRNIQEGVNVSMYTSSLKTYQVGKFCCEMVTTMRPIPKEVLAKTVAITAPFKDAHGAPIHIGDPARIGIRDITKPDYGDRVTLRDGDVPVFWACGVTVKEAVAAIKPDLAFTHYPSSMYITDQKSNPKPLEATPQVVQISRESAPFFASVIGDKAVWSLSKLEQAILEDPGKRGVAHLFQKSDLLKAVLALSHANRVAVTTGFPCNIDYEVKEETDGLPGALAICQALLALGKEVTLISDSGNQALFEFCVAHMVSIGALKAQVPVKPFSEARELYNTSCSKDTPPFDCFLAIERSGRAADGTYRTMKARDVSRYLDPVDNLFTDVQSNPHVTAICIGDGGNELGMGKVFEEVRRHITLGETIACAVPSDFVIAAGVSNWGGYAVALGLYAASMCQLHWRYRNHGINAESPPEFHIDQFLPTNEQTTSLLKEMNSQGVRDGVSGRLDQSVDGLPLQVHLSKLVELRTLATCSS